jgi:hypothetical protein
MRRSAYWDDQERRFVELGYRDYLGAVQEWWESDGRDPRFLAVSGYLLGYPFADRLYPRRARGARSPAWARARRSSSPTATPSSSLRKVARAGIGEVADALLVYVHKEDELEDVERRFPADRYVLVDDKVRILAAAKLHWGARVTTVLPKTGQFANDPDLLAAHPKPDVTIEGIGDLLDRQDLLG